MNPNSIINLPIRFTPTTLSNNEKHSMYILGIFKQDIIPTENCKYIDFYAAPFKCQIEYLSNSNTSNKRKLDLLNR